MYPDKIKIFNINLQKFFINLFILTPIVIFFSKFLSDLFLTLISLYTLICLIKTNKIDYLKSLIFFFIFIFYISLNLIINNFDFILFLKSLALIRFPLFILFPLCIRADSDSLDKKIKFLFLYPILVFLINLYFQAFFNFNIFGDKLNNDYNRVTSFFGDEFIAGTYLFFLFIILLMISKIYTPFRLIIFIFIYFGIFLSGDRTPFIIINLYLFLSLIFNFKQFFKFKYSKFIILLIPIIMLLFVSLHYTNFLNFTSIQKYENTFKNISNDIKKSENNLGLKRWPYYGMILKSYVITKNNYLFGTTYKSYRSECGKAEYNNEYSNLTGNISYNGCSTHPHNIYLEIMSEQGIIGFILFLLLIFNLFRLTKLSNTKLKENFFLIFMFCYFFPFKPHGSFYTNFNLIMLASTISFYLLFNIKKLDK